MSRYARFLLYVAVCASAHVLMGCGARAQSTGTLRLFIDPGNSFEVVVDRQYRLQKRELELTSGPHHLSFWAPQRLILDTTVNVEAGVARDLVLHLDFAPDFIAYNRQYNAFRKKESIQKYVPFIAFLGSATWTLTRYAKLNDARDQLDADENVYNIGVVPADLTQLKTVTIPADNAVYRKARTEFVIGCGLSGAAAVLTGYFWHKVHKTGPPVYEDKEKVRFDGLTWAPAPHGGWYAGLALTLR